MMIRLNESEIRAEIAQKERELKDLRRNLNASRIQPVITGITNIFTNDEDICERLSRLTVEDGEVLGKQIVSNLDVFETTRNSVSPSCADGVAVPSPKGRPSVTEVPDGTYTMNYNARRLKVCVKAKATVKDNVWTLLPGSMVCPMSPSGECFAINRQGAKIEDGVLKEPITGLKSPSAAAGTCVGSIVDGWEVWSLPDGRPLNVYRQSKD